MNTLILRLGYTLPMISKETYDIIMEHEDELNSAIVYDRDFNYNYFGFKTLKDHICYVSTVRLLERPQHLIMRVAVVFTVMIYQGSLKLIT